MIRMKISFVEVNKQINITKCQVNGNENRLGTKGLMDKQKDISISYLILMTSFSPNRSGYESGRL